jgi:hypothetical protein
MVHCQKCTTRNPLNREFCWKCGSRLLVSSGTTTFDGSIPFLEEHVLERISTLEYSISMLTKRVDGMMETIERVAASNFIDHTMIETLTDSLETAGSIWRISKKTGGGASIREFWKPKKSNASVPACSASC